MPEENEKPTSESESVWCVAANVVDSHPMGLNGEQPKRGTKHFVPGAKVYLAGGHWGMGGEVVMVIGRHRGSPHYIALNMQSKNLTNWRATLLYRPFLLHKLRDAYPNEKWDGSEASRQKAERLAQSFNDWERKQRYKRAAFWTRPRDAYWIWGIVAQVGNVDEAAPNDPIRQFAPGTRLYLLQFPAMDASRAHVMGRPGEKLPSVEAIVDTRWLENWRLERVDSPYVVARLRET